MTPNEIEWAAHDIAHDRRGGESVIGYIILAIVTAIVIAAVLCGCYQYKGARIVEGTNLAVGIDAPSTDGTLQFQFINYLTGLQLGIADNAQFRMKYTTAETNSWFGVIHNATVKKLSTKVEPCATDDNAEDEE